MAKVKYYAKENLKVGTHSFYAVPLPAGTLTFDEVCEEACANTTIGGTEYWDGSAYQNGGDTYLPTSPLTYTPAP